jgi:hypothetical protein
MVVETPEDLEPGRWYFSTPDAQPMVVVKNESEVDHEAGEATGVILFFVLGREEKRVEASDIWDQIQNETLVDISDRAGEEPEEVILEFARREISALSSKLGRHHPYSHVNDVDKVVDLQAALEMFDRGTSL